MFRNAKQAGRRRAAGKHVVRGAGMANWLRDPCDPRPEREIRRDG